jgi:putative transposase
VFFSDADYQAYLDLLGSGLAASGSEVWAWCLMPNHVHLIVVPAHRDGLRQTVANAHRKYAGRINTRNRWTGHLWQGRYGSVVMDEAHLMAAFAYVSLNPVRARLVARAEEWPWSSAHAHLAGEDDQVTTVDPALSRVGDFRAILDGVHDGEAFEAIRGGEGTGRPIGDTGFLGGLERKLGGSVRPEKRGPKMKAET